MLVDVRGLQLVTCISLQIVWLSKELKIATAEICATDTEGATKPC